MANQKNITAGIIIIGNEILSGRVQDANIQHIALKLNKLGIFLREVVVIPDVEDRIVDAARAYSKAYDYVFTTGGIGPTHDDITAASLAKAFNREVEFNQTALEIMKARYGDIELTEGRKNMARMPVGAKLIKNPVTSVPGFQIENVFVFAGIPEVMHGMLDFALDTITPGDPIISSAVHCFLTESEIAKGLQEIQDLHPDLDIGSYPFWKMGRFGASLVVRGQDQQVIDETISQVVELIKSLGGELEYEKI